MSFFAELKRRNVFRVGIAYGVAAWFILQLADVVLENIAAPEWLMQGIMLVLVIGFPIVVIFAWAFEMTPEGIKMEKDVDRSQSITSQTGRKLDRMIIAILAVAVVYLMVDKLVLQDREPAPAESAQVAIDEPETAADTGQSVAVLPFVNMSGDKDNEYFSDGLTETLLHMLAQLPELRVAARTSAFAFKGENKSIEEIAAALGVAHILEGSVQKAGNRVRITAQLIRADDGFHVWSQNYDRTLEDIFAIQDEIAQDVAGALDASLLGGTAGAMHGVETSSLSAFESYLKGLEQQALFSYGSLAIAENHFKQALALDPGFTDARLALARNHLLKNQTGLISADENRLLVEPLLAQVREQQPENKLARAFELMIELQSPNTEQGRDRLEQMVTELRALLPLIPTETLVRTQVAGILNFFFEQSQAAIEVLEAGLLIDPLEADLYKQLGSIYRDMDQFDKARRALQKSVELAPDSPGTYSRLANLEKETNNLVAALEWMRRATEVDPQDHELAANIASDLYSLGLPEEGERWYARVKALAPGSAVARRVELERALARNESDRALRLARAMIADQVEQRQGAFFTALVRYADLMLSAGMAREGYDFLVSTKPEISDYATLPVDFRAAMMQWTSVGLMTGFEPFETRKAAWLQLTANLDARGFPWRDPDSGNLLWDLVITGQTEEAITHFLNDRLSRPMALNLERHKRHLAPLFAEVYEDPRVAARLAELDREFLRMREDVRELMLEPEWNK